METVFNPHSNRIILDLLTPALGLLAGSKVGLFTANVTPNKDTLLAALTEPVGTWYMQAATAGWLTTSINEPDGTALTEANPVVFSYSGVSAGEQIYGYFLVDGSGNLLCCGRFDDAPRIMAAAGDGIVIYPRCSMPPAVDGFIEG